MKNAEKIKKLFESLIDLKFIIPFIFLFLSLALNLIQCGKTTISKLLLQRTRNALELAQAKNKNLDAKKALYKYQATQKATDPIINKNDKKLNDLKKAAKKTEKALFIIRVRVGNLSIGGVVNELNQQLGKKTKEGLPLEPGENNGPG